MPKAIDEKDKFNLDRRAAIVCSHIACDKLPILEGIRDEPLMPEDSGWQFLCGTHSHESAEDGKVWLIFEVIRLDPHLENFISCPAGSKITKDSHVGWRVAK